MTATPTAVSVIVITYQRPEYLRQCLDHLFRQSEPADQIVVVDTSEDDESARIVESYAAVRYVRGPRVGDMTASRNAALAEVSGDVIAFLDDDAFVAPDYLAALRRVYDDPSVGLGCSRTLNNIPGEDTELGAGIGRLLPDGDFTGNFAYAAPSVTPIDHGIGATMSFRRETLSVLGGFRPGYRGTCVREETDAFLRARALGYRAVFVPSAVAEHVAAPHVRGRRFDLRYDYWYYRNNALLMITNFGLASPLLWRWVTGSFSRLLQEHERSVLWRAARFGFRALGLVQGTAIAITHNFGRPLAPARHDSEGQYLRACLGHASDHGAALTKIPRPLPRA